MEAFTTDPKNVHNNSTTQSTSAYIARINYIGYVFVPLLLIVGIVGNCLTVRIMLSKAFRRLAVGKMLIFLSLSDTMVNVLFPFNKPFVREMLGVDVRAISDGGCKLFFWAYRYAKMTSSWMVVLICCERLVAVWMPVKSKFVYTTRNTFLAIAAVYVTLAIHIGYWCSWADVVINDNCIPYIQPPGLENRSKIFLICGLALYAFLPASIVLVLSTLIVYKLASIRKKRGTQVGAVVPNVSFRTNRGPNPTLVVLSVAVAFVVLVTPNATSHLVSFIKKQNIFQTNDPAMVIFREVSQAMEQLNNSVNFFLYVLFSQRFRKGLTVLCQKKEP